MSTKTLTPREQYEKAVEDVRAFADKCDDQPGGSTTEDQMTLIKMTGAVRDAKRAYDASKQSNDYADATRFLASLEDAPEGAVTPKSIDHMDRLDDGRPVNPNGMTLGEMFVQSEQYKALGGKRDADGWFRKGATLRTEPFQTGMTAKNLITGSGATLGGAFIQNDRYPVVTDLLGRRPLRMVDLVTNLTTTSDTVEYVRQTGYNNNAAPVEEADTTLDAADYTESTQNLGRKPQSDLFWEVVTTAVHTIAHWMPVTRRALADVGQMRGIIEEFLRWGLAEELDFQILRGPGTGENFTGILSTAGLDSVGSAGTDIDAVVDAIRFVEWTGRRVPNALVIHPNDWYSTGFLLAKDTTNQYIIGDPRADLRTLRTLWGLQVVVTDQMTENFALVGDFSQAVLWQREGVQLFITDSNRDWFERNILAILAEMRAAFAVLDPQAFVRITSV